MDVVDSTEPTDSSPPSLQLPPPPCAPVIHSNAVEKRLYWDRSHYQSPGEQMKALKRSSWLYIGNLAFTTRSHHIRTHFSRLGCVKSVVLGLDRNLRTPCGFGFVQYYQRSVALKAVALLSGTKLDGNIIRVELDAGFQDGREFGRGVSGGQVRDDRRHGGRKRSRDQPNISSAYSSAVSMDAALPSGREKGHYGPPAAGGTDDTDVKMEESEEPKSKRVKTED